MLSFATPRATALFLLLAAIVILGGAWIFEFAGYAPCPLCLQQRWAWYALIPFSALIALLNARGLLYLAALLMAGSAVFGAYHAGIEWKWWPGPGTCAGELTGGLPDLNNEPVISCEEAALRILGLSLAGWNAVISLALAAMALRGAQANVLPPPGERTG
jgi:disulfide bond formation protein DsbB